MKLHLYIMMLAVCAATVTAEELAAQDTTTVTAAETVIGETFQPAPVEVIVEPAPFPDATGDATPAIDETTTSEEVITPEEPVKEEPVPGEPPRPRVDPGLRNYYLRDSNLGNPTGPRAVKNHVKEKPGKIWKTELEFGAAGYRGNTDSELMLLRLKTERKKDNNSLRFGAKSSIGNKDGERDRENSEVDAGLRREIKDRWYYTAEVRYFTDKIADVDYQVVSVLSPGYEFIRRDDAHLTVELGPAYIAEKKGGEDKDFAAVRLAIMMDKLIDERILIWERFEYLPAIEDPGTFLMIAEVGVESILTDWFRLRTVVQERYDSDPAEGKEQQDLFLSASLVTVF